MGAYGEMSDDLLGHIKVMAEAKLGAPLKTAPGEASVAMEFLRRRMGLAAVKAQANYLLDGLRWAGLSGADDYGRRKERRVEDDLLRRAEEAQYVQDRDAAMIADSWDSVCKLVDLKEKANQEVDTSRMRSLLIQLKN